MPYNQTIVQYFRSVLLLYATYSEMFPFSYLNDRNTCDSPTIVIKSVNKSCFIKEITIYNTVILCHTANILSCDL